MDAQEARTQLEQMLRDLDSTTATLQNEGAGDSEELSHSDQHPGDTASEVSDADQEVALLEHAGTQREQVRAALARLDDGTYGTCVVCGRPIGDTRLEVRPEAARCLEDQAKHEASA